MAIAFDAASNTNAIDGTSVQTLTWQHVVGAGANRILIVCITGEDSTSSDVNVASVTWNGTALSQAVEKFQTAQMSTIYYLIAPESGTFDIVVTFDGVGTSVAANATSWTGAKQSAQPDAIASTGNGVAGASIALDIVTVADDCIIIDSLNSSSGGSTLTVQDAGQTQRANILIPDPTPNYRHGSSSEVATTAGTYNLGWTFSPNSTTKAYCIASFSPFVEAGGSTKISKLALMGVGT